MEADTVLPRRDPGTPFRDPGIRPLTEEGPRYPEVLRGGGIRGTVLLSFVVDTAGRVAGGSVRVLSATHRRFVDSVCEWLRGARFTPFIVDGRRRSVRIEMPFDFELERQ